MARLLGRPELGDAETAIATGWHATPAPDVLEYADPLPDDLRPESESERGLELYHHPEFLLPLQRRWFQILLDELGLGYREKPATNEYRNLSAFSAVVFRQWRATRLRVANRKRHSGSANG